MHPLDPDRFEHFNCPECKTANNVGPNVSVTECIRCRHVWRCRNNTVAQFKPGDRFFSHYVMRWGTVKHATDTRMTDNHGVTGDPMTATTWYSVELDNGDHETFDDAHGDWDNARMMTPAIAEKYGYGRDPKPVANAN